MKFEYRFPDIGEGITEGILFQWLVQEGDPVKEGQSLAEVETDKVTAEIPSAKTGTVLELKFKKGDTINVGDVFVVIETEGGSAAAGETSKEAPADQTQNQDTAEDKAKPAEEKTQPAAMGSPEVPEEARKDELEEKEDVVEEETAGVVGEVEATSREIPPSNEGQEPAAAATVKGKALATPVARAMAKDLGVDINAVAGTGPNGRVMKEDIRQAAGSKSETKPLKPAQAKAESKAEAAKAAPAAEISDERIERIPLTSIRKSIAARMTESRFTIPHTTAMDEIDVTALDAFRKKYKEALEAEGVSLTYLPFIIKAVILVLKKYPEFNSELDEETSEVLLKHFYNIGVATDTERGLMVPVVKEADGLSVVELAKAIDDITGRAKENKVSLSELKGGTFSVTNYGSIGGQFGIPIINYPEAAVLGLGRIVKKPVVEGDEIVIRKVLPLSLSYDHRTIDGASGARFLNMLRDLLSDPEMLLLKS